MRNNQLIVVFVVWGVMTLMLLGACDDDSVNEDRNGANETITLAGEIAFDEYKGGVVLIQVCENETSKSVGDGTVTQSPGKCIAEKILPKPGAFLVDADLISTDPQLDLLVYLLNDVDQPSSACRAGVYRQVVSKNQKNLKLTLVADECPIRK